MRIDRLNKIEQYILEAGSASLEQLAQHFEVSLNTIRRDVKQLLDRGTLEKVYGGVVMRTAPAADMPLPMSVRANTNRAAKEKIGRLAATLVEDHSSVFLDSGSTTPNILPYLSKKTGVTVITHSFSALYEASKYPNLRVIALGGLFYPDTSSYIDMSSVAELSRLTIDTIFIAATGVSLDNGLTNTTYFEAEIKRTLIQRGKRIVLLADHSKFDHSSIITFCRFEDLACVVTDQMPSESYLEVMKSHNIELLVAK